MASTVALMLAETGASMLGVGSGFWVGAGDGDELQPMTASVMTTPIRIATRFHIGASSWRSGLLATDAITDAEGTRGHGAIPCQKEALDSARYLRVEV